MVLTHLHITLNYNYIVIVMQDTLYIEFTLIFTETIAYQCCNHTFSTNLKGEDRDSNCEENEDDHLRLLAHSKMCVAPLQSMKFKMDWKKGIYVQ